MTRDEWMEKRGLIRYGIAKTGQFITADALDKLADAAAKEVFGACPEPDPVRYEIRDLDGDPLVVEAKRQRIFVYDTNAPAAEKFEFDVIGAQALHDAIFECVQAVQDTA